MASLPLPAPTTAGVDHALARVGGHRTPVFCQLTGLTFRQVDYLDRTGILRPSIAGANGSGSQRIWSLHDVAVGKVLCRLRALYAPRPVCLRVAKELRRFDVSEWPDRVLVGPEGRIHHDLDRSGWLIQLRDEPEGDVP